MVETTQPYVAVSARRGNAIDELIVDAAPASRLVSKKRRSSDRASSRKDLQEIVDEEVASRIRHLEQRLLDHFRREGERVIESTAAALHHELSSRLDMLEQITRLQSRTVAGMRETSHAANRRVEIIADETYGRGEWALAQSPPRYLQTTPGKVGYCPNCTSTNVRYARRSGFLEQMLRLFFISPFRCRACRHKFYRF